MPASQHECTWDSQEARRSQAPYRLPGIEANRNPDAKGDGDPAPLCREHECVAAEADIECRAVTQSHTGWSFVVRGWNSFPSDHRNIP